MKAGIQVTATEAKSIDLDPRLRGDERTRRMSAAKASVAVIIPTFNEAESIGAVVAALPRDFINRIIVVDGGSSDDTRERAQAAGAEVIAVGRGYGLACLTGAQAAEADILVYMDGDGADDPAAIATLVAPIKSGDCDFVIASRARGKREPGSMAWHQLVAGRVIGALIGLIDGVHYTDMCALRAIRRDVLLRLGMREMTYGWNLEMQMRAARTRLRVREVSVDYRPHRAGTAVNLCGRFRARRPIIPSPLVGEGR